MFCELGLRKHKYRYGYVHEPERSEKVYLRQCQRKLCNWHDWLKSAKMKDGELVTVWCGLGRFPQHAVEPVWYESYDKFVRAIELRED